MRKRFTLGLILIFLVTSLTACSNTAAPNLFLSVPSPLAQGTQTDIFLRIDNPENSVLRDATLVLGYALEGDSGIVQIAEIPLNLAEGESFKEYVPWRIDFEPVQNGKYQVH